jgi:hypothetical protein
MQQFIGCDAHKKYSIFSSITEKGRPQAAVSTINRAKEILIAPHPGPEHFACVCFSWRCEPSVYASAIQSYAKRLS